MDSLCERCGALSGLARLCPDCLRLMQRKHPSLARAFEPDDYPVAATHVVMPLRAVTARSVLNIGKIRLGRIGGIAEGVCRMKAEMGGGPIRYPFKPDRLTIATDWLGPTPHDDWWVSVNDIRVGVHSQFARSGGVPVEAFGPEVRGNDLEMDVVRTDTMLVLSLELRWDDPVLRWVPWWKVRRGLRRWWRRRHPVAPPPTPEVQVAAVMFGTEIREAAP